MKQTIHKKVVTDLETVMSMYNLLEYSKKYSKMNEPALNDKSMVDLMMVVLLIHLNLNKK